MGDKPVLFDQQAALARWAEVKPNALIIAPDTPAEDCLRMAAEVGYVGQASQWWLGDLLIHAQKHYDDGVYEQVEAATGYDYFTLAEFKSLSCAFGFSRRRENLSWSHHREVQGETPESQETLLDWCEETDLPRSRRELRERRRTVERERRLAELTPLADGPTIVCEDALSFLERVPPQSCDLLLTDPPYSTDIMDIAAFAEAWVPRALTCLKPSAQGYIFTGAYPIELQAYLDVLLKESSFEMTDVLVWTYRNTLGPSPKDAYKLNWQAVFYLRGPDAPALDCPDMVEQFSVQDVNAPDGRLGNRYHEWQKPDELAERFIRHASAPGALVLDPFAGTGTFMLAAHQLGRLATGCDLDRKVLEIAAARGCKIEG